MERFSDPLLVVATLSPRLADWPSQARAEAPLLLRAFSSRHLPPAAVSELLIPGLVGSVGGSPPMEAPRSQPGFRIL